MSKSVNATHYESIPAYTNGHRQEPYDVNAVIETPKHSRHKYALNNDYGIIAFHEVLPDDMIWPYDYGFVPHTLADDGDPLDILILSENGLLSGCLIKARVLGVVRLKKDGTENDRIIAVPLPSPGAPQQTDSFSDIVDVPRETLDEIVRFLCAYSSRQGHNIELEGIESRDAAMKLVKKTAKAFDKKSK